MSAFLVLPLSSVSADELSQMKLQLLTDEQLALIQKQEPVEIGTQESRTHDAKEMKIIQANPEGFSMATGEIFTDEEARKLKEQLGAYTEESPTGTEGGIHINTIIGSDDRIQIKDTTVFPYRRVAFLLYYNPNDGKGYICTGSIIDDNTVLTAAHCLYDTYYNNYMTNMTVYPALNGLDEAPYGNVPATNLIVTNAWASKNPPDPIHMTHDMIAVDYGVVKVPAGSFPSNLGYFQLQAASGVGNQINVTGYPDDKPDYTMWRSLGNIVSFGTYGNDAMYNHDADAMPGESGGPNFNSPDGSNFYILGVESAQDSNWIPAIIYLDYEYQCLEIDERPLRLLRCVHMHNVGTFSR